MAAPLAPKLHEYTQKHNGPVPARRFVQKDHADQKHDEHPRVDFEGRRSPRSEPGDFLEAAAPTANESHPAQGPPKAHLSDMLGVGLPI
eukprot:4784979-Pyramimonas_sp.AAC.1